MNRPQTEKLHQDAMDLDKRQDTDVLSCLLQGQKDALNAIDAALPSIARAANLMASTVESGGNLVYAAAGSSALMAFADAAELGGTFGIPPEQISILMAGGLPNSASMPGNTEDDTEEAGRVAKNIRKGDCVISISASGTTPFALTITELAQSAGASTIGIANNAGTPLLRKSDVPVLLQTPAEVIAGSTRMGAGTAQKTVLNMMSTLMGVRLGHIHDGMMVNVVADNAKLRGRAAGMISRITGVPGDAAEHYLSQADGTVKTAVLLAAGAESPAEAEHILNDTKGRLRAALARVKCR